MSWKCMMWNLNFSSYFCCSAYKLVAFVQQMALNLDFQKSNYPASRFRQETGCCAHCLPLSSRQTLTPSAFRRFFTSQQATPPKVATPPFAPSNGHSYSATPYRLLSEKPEEARDARSSHSSRLGAFQSLNGHRGIPQATDGRNAPLPPSSLVRDDVKFGGSPALPRRQLESPLGSPYPQKRGSSESRWRTPTCSPLPLRANRQGSEGEDYCCSNTSPIVFQRFMHQQKQQQLAKEAEEEAKFNPGEFYCRELKLTVLPSRCKISSKFNTCHFLLLFLKKSIMQSFREEVRKLEII